MNNIVTFEEQPSENAPLEQRVADALLAIEDVGDGEVFPISEEDLMELAEECWYTPGFGPKVANKFWDIAMKVYENPDAIVHVACLPRQENKEALLILAATRGAVRAFYALGHFYNEKHDMESKGKACWYFDEFIKVAPVKTNGLRREHDYLVFAHATACRYLARVAASDEKITEALELLEKCLSLDIPSFQVSDRILEYADLLWESQGGDYGYRVLLQSLMKYDDNSCCATILAREHEVFRDAMTREPFKTVCAALGFELPAFDVIAQDPAHLLEAR